MILGLEIQFDAKDYIFTFSDKIGYLRPNLYALLVVKPFLWLIPWAMFPKVICRDPTAPNNIFFGLLK